MFGPYLERVRRKAPMIHSITNYVTVNDCANILLACGASPIMADEVQEVEEITALCAGLVLNIGTLNARTVPAMLAAGARARSLGRPVILDPVGAGACALRTQTALTLVREVRPSVIRGNVSEMKTLAGGTGTTQGVDAAAADRVTEDNLEQMAAFAKALSQKTGAVIAMTGAIDIVADASMACCIANGHPLMSRITGSGCMLSALTGAFAAAHPDDVFGAAAAAVCAMGLAGETAAKRMSKQDGTASFRTYLIDAVSLMTPEELDGGERCEMR